MIIDTSALVAIFIKESGHERLVEAVTDASAAGVAAPTLVEAGIVLSVRMRLAEQPLLCVGNDFRQTDLAVLPA